MPKPVCVKCACFYRPKRNGVAVLEGMPNQPRAPKGNAAPEQWDPYKLWKADLWACPVCGHELVSDGSFSRDAWEHWQPDFQEHLRREPVVIRVNDC